MNVMIKRSADDDGWTQGEIHRDGDGDNVFPVLIRTLGGMQALTYHYFTLTEENYSSAKNADVKSWCALKKQFL